MSINRPGTIAALTVALALLAVPAWRHVRERPPAPASTIRAAWVPADGLSVGAGADHPFDLALAPNGRHLVFPATRAESSGHGSPQLWLHDLTTGETQALPGTTDGVLPFWSPDSRALAFFAAGRLRSFAVDTARVSDLADAPSPRGGAWHPNGDIVFAPESDAALFVRRSAGAIEPLTTLDAGAGESSHRLPVLLEDGRHVVFFVRSHEPSRSGVWITTLDQPARRTRLVSSDAQAIAAGNWLVWSDDQALLAQQLDTESEDTPALIARPVLLGTTVGRGPLDQLFASVAGDALVYGAPHSTLRELRWVDRQGTPRGVIGHPMEAWDVRIAPGGSSVAVTQINPQLGTLELFAYDGDRPLPRRLSRSIDADETAVWARDGTRLAWTNGRRTVVIRGALAELPETIVRRFNAPARVWDWSPDGRSLVVGTSRPETHEDLYLLPARPSAEPQPYAQATFNEVQAVVSPDGRWLAYASDESGRYEVYIDSFPAPGHRTRITSGGGSDPRWHTGGRTVYFRRGSEIHEADVTLAADRLDATASRRVLDAGKEVRAYDVTADGQRFLLNVPAADVRPRPITVLVNWQSLIRTGHGDTETRRKEQ